MADDRNALATVTHEQFARAVAKIAPPPAPPVTAPATFAQRAAEVLEQGRPRPPPVEEGADELSRPAMLAAIDGRIDAIMELAHSRHRADEELYAELQPELHGLLEAKDAIVSGRVKPPDETDEA